MNRLLGIIGFFIIALVLSTAIYLYGRGYRPNLDERNFQATGIVSIKSTPDDALVFIDDEEKGTTNLDITSLSSGKYAIRIEKEGFSTWERVVEVKEEEVNQLVVVLFPLAPNFQSLTFSGVGNVAVSPQVDKIAFTVADKKRSGIWLLNLSNSPIPIFSSQQINKLVGDTDQIKYSKAKLQFSPQGEQILAKIEAEKTTYFLLNASGENDESGALSIFQGEETLENWSKERAQSVEKQIEALGEGAEKLASSLEKIRLSPNQQRFFGVNKKGNFIVYDSKPTSSPTSNPKTYNLEIANSYFWYSDSKHLIMVEESRISIIDVDGKNKTTIYTGNFDSRLTVPWPDGSRIVFLTSFNSSINKLPNLYSIELR